MNPLEGDLRLNSAMIFRRLVSARAPCSECGRAFSRIFSAAALIESGETAVLAIASRFLFCSMISESRFMRELLGRSKRGVSAFDQGGELLTGRAAVDC